jgi:hypothetical protein
LKIENSANQEAGNSLSFRRASRQYVGTIDPAAAAILAALPERIDRERTISSMEDLDH